MLPVLAALVLLQDAGKAPTLVELYRHTDGRAISPAFSRDGRQLLVGGDGEVLLFSTSSFEIGKRERQGGLVEEAFFGSNGLFVLTRSRQDEAVLRGGADLKPLKFTLARLAREDRTGRAPEPSDFTRPDRLAVNGACGPAVFAADGSWLALSGSTEGLRIWDLRGLIEAKPKKQVPKIHEALLAALPVRDATLDDVKAATPEFAPPIPSVRLKEPGMVAADGERLWVALPDGHLAAVPSNVVRRFFRKEAAPSEGVVRAWERAAGEPTLTWTPERAGMFRPHSHEIRSIVLIPKEGSPLMATKLNVEGLLVTAGAEGKVRVWELAGRVVVPSKDPDPKPVAEFEGSYAAVPSKALNRLAVAERSAIALYDPVTFERIARLNLEGGVGRIIRVAFNADGSLLAATLCACSTCRGGEVITAVKTGDPSRRHGGTMVVWKIVEPAGK